MAEQRDLHWAAKSAPLSAVPKVDSTAEQWVSQWAGLKAILKVESKDSRMAAPRVGH